MHNDLTLDILEAATASLGKKLREFSQKTCLAFKTKELSREYNARMRHQVRKEAGKTGAHKPPGTSSSNHQAAPDSETSTCQTSDTNSKVVGPSSAPVGGERGRRRKTLNINTFKSHSLGDYVRTIRMYGTTDSFSTELVCDLHHVPLSGHN